VDMVEVRVLQPARDSARDSEIAAREVLLQAQAYIIENDDLYEMAAEDHKAVKTRYRAIEERRKKITGPLDEAKRETMDLFRPALNFLLQAEQTLERAMLAYRRERERQRREAEAALRDVTAKEAERLRRLAEQAEAKGKSERAEDLREQAAMLPAQQLALPAMPKVKGQSISTRWKFRIVDEAALPRDYLMADLKKIGGVVDSCKDQTHIPGVEVFAEEIISARSA
jgi:F0F1-type ATP synthase membrane subunit b/b'